MNNITEINKFVVDGVGAERIYEIFRNSYFVQNKWQPFADCCVQVDYSYADGVFRVEEKITSGISYIAEILYFFVDRDNLYSMSEHIQDGVVQWYRVDDPEGKYFVRPPKTEWELQMEERQNRYQNNTDDLPF